MPVCARCNNEEAAAGGKYCFACAGVKSAPCMVIGCPHASTGRSLTCPWHDKEFDRWRGGAPAYERPFSEWLRTRCQPSQTSSKVHQNKERL